MKIIEQSHKILSYEDPLKLIEAAGRTCYKSEDKTTEDSAARFVKMIVKSGHLSVLEHASICFMVGSDALWFFRESVHSKYLNITHDDQPLVSGNLRTWLEFFKTECGRERLWVPIDVCQIAQYLHKEYPMIFPEYYKQVPGQASLMTESEMTNQKKLIHATRTVRVITDRGIQQEITRHRPWAYSIESTRYVKYDDEIKFIKPVWGSDDLLIEETQLSRALDPLTLAERVWLNKMVSDEDDYRFLLKNGWKPEQARSILPLSLAGEIVMTATLGEWAHMLKQRTGKAAHPQIVALMKPLLKELQSNISVVFDDIES